MGRLGRSFQACFIWITFIYCCFICWICLEGNIIAGWVTCIDIFSSKGGAILVSHRRRREADGWQDRGSHPVLSHMHPTKNTSLKDSERLWFWSISVKLDLPSLACQRLHFFLYVSTDHMSFPNLNKVLERSLLTSPQKAEILEPCQQVCEAALRHSGSLTY